VWNFVAIMFQIMVVYRVEKGGFYVVTAYPCWEFSKEAERKNKKGRWIR